MEKKPFWSQYFFVIIIAIVMLILGIYLAYLIGSNKLIKTSISNIPETTLAPTSQPIFPSTKIKQYMGESYPLLPGPINNIYTLQGRLTEYKQGDLEIKPGFLIRVSGSFEYLDANGISKKVTIPLVVDNTASKESVYFGRGFSPEPTIQEHVESYIIEYMNNIETLGIETEVMFQLPDKATEAPYGQILLKELIETIHPNGFDQFALSGEISETGNEQGWLIPLDVFFKL